MKTIDRVCFPGPNKYHRCGFRFTLTFFSQGPNVPYRRHHVPTEKVAVPVILKVPHLGSCAPKSLMMRRTLSSETGSSAFLDLGCVWGHCGGVWWDFGFCWGCFLRREELEWERWWGWGLEVEGGQKVLLVLILVKENFVTRRFFFWRSSEVPWERERERKIEKCEGSGFRP